MAVANSAFDETLYRLVEQGDPAASAPELKARIDADGKFRADFDQTRKTVIALQGFGPRPASPKESTFTQRDFDRLTRDIVKGYKSKLSFLFYGLGTAYLVENPVQEGFGISSNPLQEPSDSLDRKLGDTQRAAQSIAGKSDSFSLETGTALAEINSPELANRPVDRSLRCLLAARSLKPRDPLIWSREAQALIWKDRSSEALERSSIAMELAKSPLERRHTVNTRFNALVEAEQYEEAFQTIRSYPEEAPNCLFGQWNFAVALLNLGDVEGAVDRFVKFFALHSNSEAGRGVVRAGAPFLADRKSKKIVDLRRDVASFSKLLRCADLYLGQELACRIEGIS